MAKPIPYISTRGATDPVSFEQAVMGGLARDGGLLLPAQIPDVRDCLPRWRSLGYAELAFEIFRLFSDIPSDVLRPMAAQSVTRFAHPDVVPVRQAGEFYLVELFHGPTLAFKDIALQFLGLLFEYYLQRNGQTLHVLAATSGDTGSAAVHGLRGRQGLALYVLYPCQRITPIQELQMITVPDANIHCAAIRGTFDDCQAIVKSLFRDLEFRDRLRLGAVNSINWARIMAQIVYYFYAVFKVQAATGADRVQVAVPTGNFGDIFAGYLASQMGLPIARLILATNENDILTRFFRTGRYERGPVQTTLSPAMDIQAASNFERYLYYRACGNAEQVRFWMAAFETSGALVVEDWPLRPDPLWAAGAADRAETLAAMRTFWRKYGILPDPHTAVGLAVAARFLTPDYPTAVLATAHPAKFPEAIREAVGDAEAARHPALDVLQRLPTRRHVLPPDEQAIRQWITHPVQPPWTPPEKLS